MIGILAFAPVIVAMDRNGAKKEEERIANSNALMGPTRQGALRQEMGGRST